MAVTLYARRDPRVGPVAIVIPVNDHPAVDRVARDTEKAVLAAGTRRVFTVIVDSCHAAAAQAPPALTGERHVISLPSSPWGNSVDGGIRYALMLGAHAIVVADPEIPAEQTSLATALRTVDERAGVVCSPLIQPWWRRLLAIHVLRPLLSAALGVALLDPQARTLVLSARVADAALHPRWGLAEVGWQSQHGLGVLAAAQNLGQRIVEAPTRTPLDDPQFTAPLFDKHDVEELLYAALPLCRVDRPLEPAAAAAWPVDHAGDRVPPPARLIEARRALEHAQRPPVLRRRDTGPWPEPLIAAWDGVRAGHGLYPLVHDLLDAYVDRLLSWLPMAGNGYDTEASSNAAEAASRFIHAASTAACTGDAATREQPGTPTAC
jgi:hypothetical protein